MLLLLRELEAAGTVRRTGTRRSTLWLLTSRRSGPLNLRLRLSIWPTAQRTVGLSDAVRPERRRIAVPTIAGSRADARACRAGRCLRRWLDVAYVGDAAGNVDLNECARCESGAGSPWCRWITARAAAAGQIR